MRLFPLPVALAVLPLVASPAPAQAVPFGTGCGGLSIGSSGDPAVASSDFQATLSGGPSLAPALFAIGANDQFYLGLPLPLDMGPFGAPTCTLYGSANLLFGTATDGSGNASLALPIPCLIDQIGATVYGQWAALDLGANPLGAVFSDGLAVTLTDGFDFEGDLYRFLEAQQSPTTGLVESYRSNPGLPKPFANYLATSRPAFTYDNTLAALAFLDRGDLARATDVLDAIVGSQNPDGSVPDARNAVTGAVVNGTTSTGNQAWAMLALMRGWQLTGDPSYMFTAEEIGTFLLGQKNTVGHGGFVLSPGSTVVSTEHNVDVAAAFGRMDQVLGGGGGILLTAQQMLDGARHARIFVESRYDPVLGLTYTGTDASGIVTATSPIPEDTQTWTLLALGRSKWTSGYDWMRQDVPAGLWTNSTQCPLLCGVSLAGPPFSDFDTNEVWYEGLAHTWQAAKLLGDTPTAEAARDVLLAVQEAAPNADGEGIVATCDTLATGFGFHFFNALHVAPTAWAALAERDRNPYWNTLLSSGLAAHPDAGRPWIGLNVPAGATWSCPSGDPCLFTVTGTSSGVFGDPNLEIHVLVEPTVPSAGAIFAQFPAATVQPDGTWSSSAQLGSFVFPASSGDQMRISAIAIDTSAGAMPASFAAVTLDLIPGIVTTTGVVEATVSIP